MLRKDYKVNGKFVPQSKNHPQSQKQPRNDNDNDNDNVNYSDNIDQVKSPHRLVWIIDYMGVVLMCLSALVMVYTYIYSNDGMMMDFNISIFGYSIAFFKLCMLTYLIGLLLTPYHLFPKGGLVLSYLSFCAYKWWLIGDINANYRKLIPKTAKVKTLKVLFSAIPGTSVILFFILLLEFDAGSYDAFSELFFGFIIDFFQYIETLGRWIRIIS